MKVAVRIETQSSHNGFADVLLTVGDAGESKRRARLAVDYRPIWDACGPVDKVASDVLLFATTAYAIDKLVPRDQAADAWTRAFAVRLPVSDPKRWERARAPLEACVAFLTGDTWTFEFVKRVVALARPHTLRGRRGSAVVDADAVGLFSGGLDSLIGTIDWLEDTRGRILLVGHHDGDVAGPLSDQRRLLEPLGLSYKGRIRAVLSGIGMSPSGPEISFRSRSLLFLGMALHVASTTRPGTPILIPENGNIALNVPLTPSRQGSCSTRTAHPHYLTLLRQALAALAIDTPIVNPLAAKTKGECVRECRNPELLRTLYCLSASCAKRGHKASWVRRDARQCGRCIPCLYRRAALHAAGWDDEVYGVDVCAGEVSLPDGDVGAAPKSAEDTLAMLAFVRANPPAETIARRLMTNGRIPSRDAAAAAALVSRAMDEMRTLITAKAIDRVRHMAGLPRQGRRRG